MSDIGLILSIIVFIPALAGLVLGGKGENVTFVATLKGGQKLATTDSKTFTNM